MKLDSDTVDEISAVLRASGAVPIPGGHGVWFPDIRSRFPALASAPGVEARCYICLTLLGDGDGEQRWNPKEWWPHSFAWFSIFCPAIAERLDGPHWAYLLAAMRSVAEQWCAIDSDRRHLTAFIVDCHRRAEERLRQITRTAKANGRLSSVTAGRIGEEISAPDARWAMAATALSGTDAEAVEMLHFMHILHSGLGVAQHSMDQRYSTRMPYYFQLQEILEKGLGVPQSLLEPASRIAAAMGRTALLVPVGQPSVALDGLAAQLPACFQTASAHTHRPSRAMIGRRLQSAPVARDRLLAAYDLAIIVADLAMDFFRSGGVDGPAFRVGAYDYLHSLIRYGPKIADGREDGELRPATVDHSPPTGRPMTRSFAERMRGGLLVEPARERCSLDLGIIISAAAIAAQPFPQNETGPL
jgi:hypothetical protein